MEGRPETMHQQRMPGAVLLGSDFKALEGKKTLTGEVRFEHQGRARAGQRNKGIMRLYAEPESGRLLGTEMCAPAGEHMAHLLALAIDRSLTVQDMLRLPFYHPVLEEGLRTALRDLLIDEDLCGSRPRYGRASRTQDRRQENDQRKRPSRDHSPKLTVGRRANDPPD